MANQDRPSGAKPVKHLDGSPWNGKFNIYYFPATDSTDTFIGDFVKLAGSADTLGLYPTIAQVAATNEDILGVLIGLGSQPEQMYDVTNLARRYRPRDTAMYAAVVDAPDVIYEMQEDSVVSSLDVTNVGECVDITVGSGDTTTGLSAMEIDSDTAAAASGQLRILRLVNRADNELGTNAKWEVLVNEHIYKRTAGV